MKLEVVKLDEVHYAVRDKRTLIDWLFGIPSSYYDIRPDKWVGDFWTWTLPEHVVKNCATKNPEEAMSLARNLLRAYHDNNLSKVKHKFKNKVVQTFKA